MKIQKSKEVILFTRPLTPPWDEASKNLAFDIARNCEGDFSFTLLTSNKEQLEKALLGNNSIGRKEKFQIKKIYSSPNFNLFQKIRLLIWFFLPNSPGRVVHFLFTPRSLTSFLIRLRLFFSPVKTIQTIATFNQNSILPKKLGKVFFADKVVVQSRHTQQKLEKLGLSNTQLIYPGIDLEKFRPIPKNKPLMTDFGIRQMILFFFFQESILVSMRWKIF